MKVYARDVNTSHHPRSLTVPLALFWGSVLYYLAHYNHTGIAMFMSYGFCQSLLFLKFLLAEHVSGTTSHCMQENVSSNRHYRYCAAVTLSQPRLFVKCRQMQAYLILTTDPPQQGKPTQRAPPTKAKP